MAWYLLICLYMAEEPKFDARLAEGVAYFEQMLQLMPEDRVTLEFLVVAYEQLDRHEDAQKALVSLTKILIKERDNAALEGLLPRLEESDYPEAKALSLKVKTLIAPAPDLTPEVPKEMTEEEMVESISAMAVKSELALVDELVDGKMISEEDAKHLRAQIEATPTAGQMCLVSGFSKKRIQRFPSGALPILPTGMEPRLFRLPRSSRQRGLPRLSQHMSCAFAELFRLHL